jgi:hypothetical protein
MATTAANKRGKNARKNRHALPFPAYMHKCPERKRLKKLSPANDVDAWPEGKDFLPSQRKERFFCKHITFPEESTLGLQRARKSGLRRPVKF